MCCMLCIRIGYATHTSGIPLYYHPLHDQIPNILHIQFICLACVILFVRCEVFEKMNKCVVVPPSALRAGMD